MILAYIDRHHTKACTHIWVASAGCGKKGVTLLQLNVQGLTIEKIRNQKHLSKTQKTTSNLLQETHAVDASNVKIFKPNAKCVSFENFDRRIFKILIKESSTS